MLTVTTFAGLSGLSMCKASTAARRRSATTRAPAGSAGCEQIEVIDVDHQHRQRLAVGTLVADRAAQRVVEVVAVRDAGQRIGPGDGLQFGTVALQAVTALDAAHLRDGAVQALTNHRDQDADGAGKIVDADQEQRHQQQRTGQQQWAGAAHRTHQPGVGPPQRRDGRPEQCEHREQRECAGDDQRGFGANGRVAGQVVVGVETDRQVDPRQTIAVTPAASGAPLELSNAQVKRK